MTYTVREAPDPLKRMGFCQHNVSVAGPLRGPRHNGRGG